MEKNAENIKKIENFVQKSLAECENHQLPWRELAAEIYDLIDGRVESDSETPIHLNMMGTAFERISAELTKGLVSFDKWLTVENEVGLIQEFMLPLEAKRLLYLGLDDSNPKTDVLDMMKTMLVENRSGLKIHSYIKTLASGRETFKLRWLTLDLTNYACDPAHPEAPVYEFFFAMKPKYQVKKIPKLWKHVVDKASPFKEPDQYLKMTMKGDVDGTMETAMTSTSDVRVIEFWGTVLDEHGDVVVWDNGSKKGLPLENVQIIFLNNGQMASDPIPNKRYAQTTPFVSGKLLRSSKSTYRPGLLAASAEINKYADTLISAATTGGIKAAHNVTVIHKKYLANPEVVENGLLPNTTLLANEDMPDTAKLFTTEKIGDIPGEVLQLYNLFRTIFAENSLANDQFLNGMQRSSDTATGQIQSQNVIGGLFESFASVLEDEIIERVGQESFQEMLRNRKFISDEELLWVFSGDADRAAAFKEMDEKDVLKLLGTAFKFRGKGLRSIAISKQRANAYVQWASMLLGNPVAMQEFKDTFSLKTFFAKGLESLGLDPEELHLSEQDLMLILQRKMLEQQVQAQIQAQGGEVPEQGGAANPMMGAANPSEMPVGQQEGQAF